MLNKHTRGRAIVADKNGGIEESKYRNILKELGIKKPDNEPLSAQELRRVFIHLQEDLFIGS